eukprot:TRINITY_DN17613_c0_g1_i1.p1 TRINITY_DN17613_c0_g1~~TRINITY_DN17613_c0_g1_i1.p1  ORF type:complete len:327 (+),score=54.68 TRINITY_DN17613_c0_g1_i1:175-1155(+)
MAAFSFERLKAKLDNPLAIAILTVPAVLLLLQLISFFTTNSVGVDSFNSCSTEACELQIPKIIHQTYKSKDLPEAWAETPELWKRHHEDWTYEFWDDERNRAFIAEHYAWFLPQFDRYPNNIQRADSIRYFILYHYGGVYADMDIQPVRNIEPMLGDATAVLPVTPNLGLTNAFMACTKHNPFMKHVTESLESHADRWFHFFRHWQILTSTGPTFLWGIADSYKGDDKILRVPASVWGKCMICASSCPVVEEGYFQHLHGDSWHNWDSWLFTYVIFCHHYTAIFLGWLVVLLVLLRQDAPGWMWSRREVIAASVLMFLILMMFQGA